MQLAVVDQPEVARSQPPIARNGLCVGFRIPVVAARDVCAGNVHVANPSIYSVAFVVVANDTHAALRDGSTFAHNLHRVRVGPCHRHDRAADSHPAAVEPNSPDRGVLGRKGDGERRLGKPVATGYIAVRASFAGARRVRNSSHNPAEMGSAPLEISRTADRSSPSTGRSASALR